MSGFDPSRSPQRTHSLIVSIGADTTEDLIWSLRELASDAMRGKLSTNCCSGSPSVGFMYSYRHDPAQTHDRYFREIDEWLARDTDGSGEAGETTKIGSTRRATAGAAESGIAQNTPSHPPSGNPHDPR